MHREEKKLGQIVGRGYSIEIQMRHGYEEASVRCTNVRMLKTNTAELLQAVEEGEEVVITEHDPRRPCW